MLMVIFGAGASFDSLGDKRPQSFKSDIRPPLANGLFEMRGPFGPALTAFPQFRALIPQLRAAKNIEHELEVLRSEQDTDPYRAVQLNAIRYYLRQVITVCSQSFANETHGVTNYASLLERIRHWQVSSGEPVALVTFNYDTLLEDACHEVFEFQASSLHSYIANTHYKVFKPHGSINWVRIVDNELEPTNEHVEHRLIRLGKDLRLRPGQHINAGSTMEGHYTFPAIAIPVETKSESEFEFPESHLKELRDAIRQTSRLLMIGWRGTEQHFLNLWKAGAARHLKRIQIVAGTRNDAEEVYKNIGIATQASCKLSADGFSEFVLTDELDDFLSPFSSLEVFFGTPLP